MELDNIHYPTLILGFFLVSFLFETYLDYRQHKCYKIKERPKELIFITDEEFAKAQAYQLDKSSFGFVTSFFSFFKSLAILVYLFYPWLWSLCGNLLTQYGYDGENEYYRSILFFILESIISSILDIPFSLYSTFVIEERHGFNKQTLLLFFTDLIKSFLLTLLFVPPILSLVLWVIRWGGQNFPIYATLAVISIQILFLFIYPVFIQPCFNKVAPLKDGSLRTRIENLAAKVAFPLTQLYEIGGSKRSAHSNAYMYGFGKNKRIVLFDTLIQQSTEEEVEAVLAHELGHWKFSHMPKNLFLIILQTIGFFYAFNYFLNDKKLFAEFGFGSDAYVRSGEELVQPIVIGLMLFQMLLMPLSHVLSFGMNVISRRFEYQADDFAKQLGYRDLLCSALIKLQKENKSSLIVDPLYGAYHHSHPHLLQRLAALRDDKKKNE